MPIPFADNVVNGDVLQNFHTNQYGPPVNSLIDGSNYYFVATGPANAYAVSIPPPNVVTALTAGMIINFRANLANTGPASLQVNALSPVALVRPDGSSLQAGDIVAGMVARALFDGTAFQVVGVGGASAGSALYGDGSDGDVVISADTSLTADMQYQNLTVATGVTVSTEGFIVRVRGTLTLDGTGTLRCRGAAGQNGNAGSNGRNGGDGGAAASLGGGGKGGKGGNAGASGQSGVSGDAGGAGGTGGNGPGGAGGGSSLSSAALVHWARAMVGQSWLRPNLASLVKGGSGGGGAGSSASQGGPGGGGGGGVLVVCARHVAGSGRIRVPGGNGGNAGTSVDVGGGGGGGGGFALVITGDLSSSWSLTAGGGTGGTPSGTGTTGSNGADGFTQLITGAIEV